MTFTTRHHKITVGIFIGLGMLITTLGVISMVTGYRDQRRTPSFTTVLCPLQVARFQPGKPWTQCVDTSIGEYCVPVPWASIRDINGTRLPLRMNCKKDDFHGALGSPYGSTIQVCYNHNTRETCGTLDDLYTSNTAFGCLLVGISITTLSLIHYAISYGTLCGVTCHESVTNLLSVTPVSLSRPSLSSPSSSTRTS